MQPEINFLILYHLVLSLTQIIVAGNCSMFDINFGCMYLSLYSVGGMYIGFGGFDQYCNKNYSIFSNIENE